LPPLLPFFAARLRFALARRLLTVAAAIRFAVLVLRPRLFTDYCRSAVSGLTVEARLAGTMHATAPVTRITTPPTTKVRTSVSLTPKSSERPR
jgi:hypothetical protein